MTRRGRSPRALTVAALTGVLVLAAGCASAPPVRMRRALDASMERVLRTESYLRSVAGISSHPSRLTRGDGFVYISDVAPILRYLAEVRDTARFRALRAFTTEKMMRRGPSGFEVARRYRDGAAFEAATPYGRVWTTQAFAEGWRLLGDTVSASVLAQLAPPDKALAQHPSELSQLSITCGDAMDVVTLDPAPARAVLRRARTLVGSAKAAEDQAALGSTAVEGEVDLLSCLTRTGLALRDPDATVRYLDRLLDRMEPLVKRSGRPDMGTAADILLTLRRVREAGPSFSR
ncbi:MAG: hypothetical protein Q8K55_13070 [Gemmatimonadaceae bacterium]|nr:hypothetical protein [Gemmatimonadaceae bacterium]